MENKSKSTVVMPPPEAIDVDTLGLCMRAHSGGPDGDWHRKWMGVYTALYERLRGPRTRVERGYIVMLSSKGRMEALPCLGPVAEEDAKFFAKNAMDNDQTGQMHAQIIGPMDIEVPLDHE